MSYKGSTADLVPLTIDAISPGGVIQAEGTLYIMIPSNQPCRFDTTVSLGLSGNAASKAGFPYFLQEGRVLAIPVQETFSSNDVLVIEGLRLQDVHLLSAMRLELDYTGDGIVDTTDLYPITATGVWPGGSYDGWSGAADERFRNVASSGTILLIR